MARDNRISMPQSGGGLVRYFDEYKSKITIKPGHVVILSILIIIIELFLHMQGNRLFGL